MTMTRAVALALLASAVPAHAEDVREAMERYNAKWLAAFNAGDAAALPAMYTADAVVFPPGAQSVTGAGPIRQFWESRLKAGVTDHTFEIVSVYADGKYAYQVSRWTAAVVKESGERTPYSGNTVRVFERQSDGTWLAKVHIYTRNP